MNRTRTSWKLVGVFWVLTLLLTSCAANGTSETSDGSDDQPTTPAADDGTPTEGGQATSGVLRVAMPSIVNSVDFERSEGRPSFQTMPLLSSTLVRVAPPASGNFQRESVLAPELAESWEINEDGTQVTFVLRETDSAFGNPLTTADVQWSFDRAIASEGRALGRLLMNLGGWDTENLIEIVDDRTFRLNIADPRSYSLTVASMYWFGIQDSVEAQKHATDDDPWANEWLATNAATFGPYVVEDFDPGQELRLTANPNYWGGALPTEEVIIRTVPESSTRLQLVETGGIEIATELSLEHLASLESNDEIQVVDLVPADTEPINLNHSTPPFDDVRVRRAISLAIDREAISNSVYLGLAPPAIGLLPAAFGTPDPSDPLRYDPDAARALLAEAGYADGFSTELAFHPATVGTHTEGVAIQVQSMLSEVGIDVELNKYASKSDFDTDEREGNLAMNFSGHGGLVFDVGFWADIFYTCEGLSQHTQGYCNEEVDELVQEISTTEPGPARTAAVGALNDILIQDMPDVPIVFNSGTWAIRSEVEGYVSYPLPHPNAYEITVRS